MKSLITQRSLGPWARAAALGLLALAATLFHPREARAQWTTSGTNTTTTSNVGIGTTAPVDRLHVDGRTRGGDFLSVGNGGHQSWKDAQASRAANFGLAVPGQPATDNIQLSTYASGVWTSRMTVLNSNGNVGVGTTAPQSLLDISGSTGLTLRNNGASSGFSFFDRPTVPGDQVVFQGNGGNYSLFNVSTRGANVGTEKASGMAFWTVDIGNTANATMFQMQYTPNYGPVFFTYKFGTGAQGDKKISFQTAWNYTSSPPTQLVLDTNGSVGVGTAAPSAKLHVAGDIRVDGNINAKYQDVAEWVPTTQKLRAGTVVVLDPERTNHVLASKGSYDTSVAGVISERPGLSLGEGGEGRVLVATTGRVKVRVDATRAPVKIGDLIVTSDTEGVAMKSEPISLGGRRIHAPGTIIGKALEPLAGGTGEILVLLSLQ